MTGPASLPSDVAGRPHRARTASGWVLLVLSAVAAACGSLAWWASGLADSETFAARATTTLAQDDVNELVAERLVDRVAGDTVLGTTAKPAAVSVTEAIVSSEQFAAVFQSTVRTAHEQLVGDRDDSVTVALAEAGPLLAPALGVSPENSAAVLEVVDSPVLVRTAHVLSVMDTVAWCSLLLWLLTTSVAVLLARDRRRMLARVGAALVVVGVLLAVAIAVTVAVVRRGEPQDAHAAAASMLAVFTAPLLKWSLFLGALGAGLWCSAFSTPPDAPALVRRVTDAARAIWRRPVVRATGPLLAAAAGLVLVTAPLDTLRVAAVGLGLLLLVGGVVVLVGSLVRLVAPSPGAAPSPERPARRWSLAAVLTVAFLLLAATVALVRPTTSSAEAVPDPDGAGCNGLPSLCDLRLDQIAMVGSHNSMSTSAEPGWYLGEQRLSISGQLAAGVRALMFDVYPGYVSDGQVRTDLSDTRTADAAEADLTDEGRATLEHLGLTVGTTPPEGAEIKAYLCHAYCELGASELVAKLRDIGDFLAHEPNEVLVIILQDYIDGEQTQQVFEEAGLMDRVWPVKVGDPMPTLREMIESRRNIAVLSENHGGEVPWMPAAYAVTEETPYEFASPEQFNCQPNRGGTGKPLFLVNHWIRERGHQPLEDAAVVNGKKELDDRLAQCRAERDRQPGILALDFVDIGDGFTVVGDLNRALAGP